MRHIILRLATALPLLATTGLPFPAKAQQAAPAAIAASTVRVRTGQQTDHGRVVFHLGQIPSFDVRKTSEGQELRLRGAYELNLSTLRPLAELASITTQRDGEDTVILLRLTCDCVAETVSGNGMLWVNLRPSSSPAMPAMPPAPSAGQVVAPASGQTAAPAAASRQPPAERATTRSRQDANRADTIEATRRRLLEDAVRLNLITRDQADAMLRAAPPPAGRATPAAPARAATRTAPADDLAQLRQSLAAQLAILNGAPPSAPAAAGSPPAPAPAPTPPPRPSCAAPFDMATWVGEMPEGGYPERLAQLRRAMAASAEAPDDVANLVEFQVGLGLLNEALDLLDGRIAEDVTEAARIRMQRARDVARLLRRQPIEPTSPLLAEAPDCEREDLGLWQALAAAAASDTESVVRLAPRARAALRNTPERLRFALALALTDAAWNDLETLRALVAPIRSIAAATEAEAAGRNWLLARIAGLEGSREEELLSLTRAAQANRTVPGLFARTRLAAMQAAPFDGRGADANAQRAEARLLDFARTYRFDSLGEEAAMLYAQLLLGRGDLSGALAAADEASQSGGRPGLESRGANLAARILRLLLVDAKDTPLPPPNDRLALYWRYEGYATPGERGDDIRLGAARLMLEQGLAEAALDILRQLAPATAQTVPATLLLARAEGTATQGDPQRALALLRALPASDEMHRAAAVALSRLGRPADAARELEGLRSITDLTSRANNFYAAQSWPEAAASYAELLRQPALDAAARADATARYVSAAALSPQRSPAVPRELLAPQDPGTAALLQLTAEPVSATASGRPRMESVRGALDRAKRIEALLPPAEAR